MGERTHRDEVDATLGIVADGVVGDTARRLGFVFAADDFHRLASELGREVVEHDAVDAAHAHHFAQLVEIAHLDFDLQVFAFLFQIVVTAGNGVFDTASKIDMVVFQQNHVEEPDAVVHPAAYLHGSLLEHAHARGGLAGVEYAGVQTLEPLHIAAGHGGDTAHALHHVEHEALGLQQRLDTPLDYKSHIAGFHLGTVFDIDGHLQLGVEAVEYLAGYLYTGQYAGLLNQQFRFSHGRCGYTTQGRVVSVAYILGKCQVDQLVDQLLGSFHIFLFLYFLNNRKDNTRERAKQV